MTIQESLSNRLGESWGLWGIIISHFIMARFNYVMQDVLTIENMATNQLYLSLAWIIIFLIVTILRVYGDTNSR